jgi:hypothetical protein
LKIRIPARTVYAAMTNKRIEDEDEDSAGSGDLGDMLQDIVGEIKGRWGKHDLFEVERAQGGPEGGAFFI